MASKLAQLRNGIPPHKLIDIRDQKFNVVIVSSDIVRQCEEDTEEYANNSKGKINERAKDLYFDSLLTYHCLRDANDINQRVADSAQEVREVLDTEDIGRVTRAYSELMMNKAPKIELLDDKGLEEIKNYLEVTPLNGLSTVSVVHLTNFLQTIHS